MLLVLCNQQLKSKLLNQPKSAQSKMTTSYSHPWEDVLLDVELTAAPSARQHLSDACWEPSPYYFSLAWPFVQLPIHLSTYLYLHSLPSFLHHLLLLPPSLLLSVLLNYLTSDGGLGCWARRRWSAREGGKGCREKGRYGGVRHCRKPWVSRQRNELWEGRHREFIDSFRWYGWRERGVKCLPVRLCVRVHAPIDRAEKVTELRGD